MKLIIIILQILMNLLRWPRFGCKPLLKNAMRRFNIKLSVGQQELMVPVMVDRSNHFSIVTCVVNSFAR